MCVCVCVLVYSLTRSRASELTKIAHRTCIYIDPVFAYQKNFKWIKLEFKKSNKTFIIKN